MLVYISHAGADERLYEGLTALISEIASLGHQPWPQSVFTVEPADEREAQLQASDVVLFALSPSYLGVVDWNAEHRRATRAGKPILLVILGPLGGRLPAVLRDFPSVGFRIRTDDAPFLRTALREIRAADRSAPTGAPPATAATPVVSSQLGRTPAEPSSPIERPRRRSPAPALSSVDPATAAPSAGWYREHRTPAHRYWDGRAWTGDEWEAPRAVFISYSRMDEAAVDDLVGDLRMAQLEVWRDTALGGGVDWWQEILRQIRGAAVLLQALSDSSRGSEPCRLERQYADALGIPVLPVQVGTIGSIRTWDVSAHQIIDYRSRDPEQRIRVVAGAMSRLADRCPPPSPPPIEPDAPYGYLRGIRQRLDLTDLDRRQQYEIFLDVRERLDEESDAAVRADLVRMLRDLADRPDAVRIVMNDVAALLDRLS